MDKLDQIFEDWSSLLEEVETPTDINIIKQQNKSTMENFINYELKVNKGRRQASVALFMVSGVILTALLFYSLLTYFRGAEVVTYDMAEMIIGCFLIFIAIAVMMYNIKKIQFPNINTLPTNDYLIQLKEHLLAWQKREIPVLIVYVLFLPAGVALFLKSVFVVPFLYLFVPVFILYNIFMLLGMKKNMPEFKAILSEIDHLQKDLHSPA